MQALRVKVWLRAGCLLGAALAGASGARAQDLKDGNPFLPENYQQDETAAEPEPVRTNPLDKLELRSITSLGKIKSFSIYDTSISKGFWVNLDETVQGVSVSDYNKSDESVLVRSGGFSKRLKLKEAKIVALAVQPPTPAPAQAAAATAINSGQAPNMTTGTATLNQGKAAPINNLSDDEVRARMQRVAEEIRRRRAQRRQMAEEAAAQKQP
jgi:hypothetical protein